MLNILIVIRYNTGIINNQILYGHDRDIFIFIDSIYNILFTCLNLLISVNKGIYTIGTVSVKYALVLCSNINIPEYRSSILLSEYL